MIRNLKAFGLALLAATALGAFAAQGASAVVEHSFRSTVSHTQLTGANETNFVFTLTPELKWECSTVTFEGTNIGEKRDTLTAHPQFGSCKFEGEAATVDTNGCNFIFDSDTTASAHSGSAEHAGVSIECEAGHHIMVTLGICNLTLNANHNSVAVNQGLHGIKYTELASHSGKQALTQVWTVRTVHYTTLGGSFCGLLGHAGGTYTNGIIDATATLTSYADSSVVSGSTTTGRIWSHGEQFNLSLSTPE